MIDTAFNDMQQASVGGVRAGVRAATPLGGTGGIPGDR
jgi:hypothetical protein